MRIEVNEAELDYVYRLLLGRPMGEVEPLVLKLRVQITRQQVGASNGDAPASGQEGAAKRGNGSGGDDDIPALP